MAALLGPRQCGKTTLARLLVERDGGTLFLGAIERSLRTRPEEWSE